MDPTKPIGIINVWAPPEVKKQVRAPSKNNQFLRIEDDKEKPDVPPRCISFQGKKTRLNVWVPGWSEVPDIKAKEYVVDCLLSLKDKASTMVLAKHNIVFNDSKKIVLTTDNGTISAPTVDALVLTIRELGAKVPNNIVAMMVG